MKKHLYKIAGAISGALLLAFVVFLVIDSCTYNDMLTSAPFYAYVIVRFFEFLLPSQLLFGIGILLKKKWK